MFSDRPAPQRSTKPLSSTLTADPEMRELIELFNRELPARVDHLSAALLSGDRDALRTLAHQLKGAGHGYGYPAISEAAAEVEAMTLAAEADISRLAERVEQLINVCRRAAAGTSNASFPPGSDDRYTMHRAER